MQREGRSTEGGQGGEVRSEVKCSGGGVALRKGECRGARLVDHHGGIPPIGEASRLGVEHQSMPRQ